MWPTKYRRCGKWWICSLTPRTRCTATPPTSEFFKRRAAFEAKHAGKRVWVHGYHIEVRPGEHRDQPFFYDRMFSTVFNTLDEIEALCDQHYGEGVWDEYSLYPDDKLPKPLPIDF